jgi:hypothetical protein
MQLWIGSINSFASVVTIEKVSSGGCRFPSAWPPFGEEAGESVRLAVRHLKFVDGSGTRLRFGRLLRWRRKISKKTMLTGLDWRRSIYPRASLGELLEVRTIVQLIFVLERS